MQPTPTLPQPITAPQAPERAVMRMQFLSEDTGDQHSATVSTTMDAIRDQAESEKFRLLAEQVTAHLLGSIGCKLTALEFLSSHTVEL